MQLHRTISSSIFALARGALVSLVFFVVLEIAARMSHVVLEIVRQKNTAQKASDFKAEWLTMLTKEESPSQSHASWSPYVYWRRDPFNGNVLHIDSNGLRRTWEPLDKKSKELTVWMFGGSTVWGYGSRDEHTIPSEVAKKLNARYPETIHVVNYGEAGYVSTQEVLTLLLELRKGKTPNAVIFYDGINDIFSYFENGVAGLTMSESERRKEFNSRKNACFMPRDYLNEHVYLYRLANNISSRLKGKSPTWLDEHSQILNDSSAESVLTAYEHNTKIVKALGKEYGFSSYFFWTPTVYTKKHRTPFEETLKNIRGEQAVYEKVQSLIKRSLSRGALPRVTDLSGSFDAYSQTLYTDYAHITEEGNEIIAQRITDAITSAPFSGLSGPDSSTKTNR